MFYFKVYIILLILKQIINQKNETMNNIQIKFK